jgi:hypothetical protein
VTMKRASTSEVTCLACGDLCHGVVLVALASVVEAGGSGHVDLCVDCVIDMFNATGAKDNARVISSRPSVIHVKGETFNANNLSGSDPVSGFSLSLPLGEDPERPRVGRGDSKAYPEAFEEIWVGCVKRRGNKEAAFKAWLKVKPHPRLTIERYLLRTETRQWKKGFVPHLSRWLNERGWETEPDPSEFGSVGNGHGGDLRVGHHRAEVKPRPEGKVAL